jgi:hypothetical protein
MKEIHFEFEGSENLPYIAFVVNSARFDCTPLVKTHVYIAFTTMPMPVGLSLVLNSSNICIVNGLWFRCDHIN